MDPWILIQNLFQYADRAGTFVAAAVLLAMIVGASIPRPRPREIHSMRLGAIWTAGGFALTVFVPVRSSLYVCFPSVGVALMGAALLSAVWSGAGPRQRARLRVIAAVLPFLLVPLLWSRNARMMRTAELSTRALESVQAQSPAIARGKVVVIHDDVRSVINVGNAFGTLIQDAVRLKTGLPAAEVWLEPPPPGWETAGLQPPRGRPAIHLFLRGGELVRVPNRP